MKTWLIVGVLAVGIAILMASSPNKDTDSKNCHSTEKSPFTLRPDSKNNSSDASNETNCHPPQWYAALKRPEWLQLIAAVIGIFVIGWQSWETRRAAKATEISAKAAKDNIDLLISKERARLRVNLEELDLSPQVNGVYEVKFTVSIFGTTPAFIIDTKCVAFETPLEYIANEEMGEAVMFPLNFVPAVIPTGSEPIQEFAIFHFASDGNSDAIMAEIEADRLFVEIRGFIIYKDVFDRERETRFRYVWKYRDKGLIPGLKRWGSWEKCGKEEENKET